MSVAILGTIGMLMICECSNTCESGNKLVVGYALICNRYHGIAMISDTVALFGTMGML